MQFEPRQPDAGVNVSKVNRFSNALTLLVGVTVGLVVAAIVLIALADVLVRFVPVSVEARLGDLTGRWIEPTDDPRTEDVQALTARLAARWPDAPYTFEAIVIEDEAPNAFALPGGLIVVTDTLLDGIGSENELAFVLAHELGHFYYRHHMHRLGRSAALAVLLASVGLGDGIAETGSFIAVQSFSRDQEFESDAFALSMVYEHYGHLASAWIFFERIRQAPLGEIESYLSTHPEPARRIDVLRELAAERGWTTEGRITPWHWSS